MKILCLRDSDVVDLLAVLHVHRRDGWDVADRLLYIVEHQREDPVLAGPEPRIVQISVEADGFAMMARYDSPAGAAAAWARMPAPESVVVMCGWETPPTAATTAEVVLEPEADEEEIQWPTT